MGFQEYYDVSRWMMDDYREPSRGGVRSSISREERRKRTKKKKQIKRNKRK